MREISFVAYVHALMTQKSCAVGMRNAILRNHLKFPDEEEMKKRWIHAIRRDVGNFFASPGDQKAYSLYISSLLTYRRV